MAQGKLSEQKLKEIRELTAAWGKIVARRTFPEAGPLDFSTREQVALAAAVRLPRHSLHPGRESRAAEYVSAVA